MLEADDSEKKQHNNIQNSYLTELSKFIMEAYSDQLKVYSDEKIKKGTCKGYSERELITNMLAFVLFKRGLDKAWMKLYKKGEIDFREGRGELETLNREFRLADIDGMKYVWRRPTTIEFYIQARRISLNHLNYGLIVRLGRNALERHSYEEINKQYRDSVLNL